ncbi:MAG: alcohol dehydrogenase catalytic domain-containing protein, partial [Proteobacteria bacterium]|nr:alcohol dehydrogenase catalytic domain-containing protein [Pseudomonadota bacterium]
MKALVLLGPERMELRDEPAPAPRPGEALVRVEAAGICGSDLHSYLGRDARRPPPVILGHEACGIVESGPRAGRRVVINPQITCGRCAACRSGRSNLCIDKEIVSIPPRQGTFAELISVPEENLIEVPDGLDPLRAALAEPLATSFHAAVIAEPHLAKPLDRCAALVIGGGAIGLGVALVLAARGCDRIHLAERNPLRRARLQAQREFQVYDPDSEAGPQGVECGPKHRLRIRDELDDADGEHPVEAAVSRERVALGMDDLDAMLLGTTSMSGTLNNVCGTDSKVEGINPLVFTNGSLAAGATCSFDVDLLVRDRLIPNLVT